jgi:hypothetical protein
MLFKDNTKLPDYASFKGTVEFYAIKRTLQSIERNHIVKLIGSSLYNSLDAALALITNEDNLSTANKLLLHECRNVIGPYLGYYYAPIAEISLSASGARRSETDSEKTAYQYQVTKFRQAELLEAEIASELLLQFLEENRSSYPLWVDSAEFKKYRSLFIQTASDFNDQYNTASPYRNFWAMRWKMVDVEAQQIKPKLGDALYNALKAKLAASTVTLSDKEKELLVMLKKAIAYYTVAFALPHLTVRLDDNGLTVVETGGTNSNDNNNRTAADANKLSVLINEAISSAREWMNLSIKFLQDNPADFSLYPLATVEKSPSNGNENLKGSFGLF